MLELSPAVSHAAKLLWAKASRENDELWLPLYAHMSDAAEIARLLWRDWVPNGTKRIIGDGENAERMFMFLAAAHDLGKVTPAFQLGKTDPSLGRVKERVLNSGPACKSLADPRKIPHALASQYIAEEHGLPRALAVVLGGHHGAPPSYDALEKAESYSNNTGVNDKSWRALQDEFFNYALHLADVTLDMLKTANLSVPAQMLLTGLVIMADWISSDESRFPYTDDSGRLDVPARRASEAWQDIDLPVVWEPTDEGTWGSFDIYEERFGRTPRPVQTEVFNTVIRTEAPGIVVIEAPMGEGKTEAALAAAEILAAKTGRGGVFFALPTQATSDGMFPRVIEWLKRVGDGSPHAITLAHGKSRFNEQYKGIKNVHPNVDDDAGNENENVIVHDWFEGRKKGLLADFTVGTVDHILMGGLKQKHLALRHLGLANKVVIIDECHAYDAYMNSYLFKALRWLGAYRTPVVILSATLPSETRYKLVEAYMDKDFAPYIEPDPVLGVLGGQMPKPAWATSCAYPLITYTDGGEVKQEKPAPSGRNLTVEIAKLDDSAVTDKLEELLAGGGCAGVVVNTVKRAQETARILSEHFGDGVVELLHSRFVASERVRKELELRENLGCGGETRPDKLIVVGTQVIEQSLDLDFDVLFTDVCPMDLLLQRMGRLHRHERTRPSRLKTAACFVLGIEENGFNSGSEKVYGAYMLMRTEKLLPERVELPDDIPELVQRAYNAGGLEISGDAYERAKSAYENRNEEKERRADAFQIRDPIGPDLIDLLNTMVSDDPGGHRAEASVRDAGDSIEVIAIQRRSDGRFYTLPFLAEYEGIEIPREAPPDELAGIIAGCTVKLPPSFTFTRARTAAVISEFEKHNRKILPPRWQDSHWLKDELFLALDESSAEEIAGYRLTYDEKYGLFAEKMEG